MFGLVTASQIASAYRSSATGRLILRRKAILPSAKANDVEDFLADVDADRA